MPLPAVNLEVLGWGMGEVIQPIPPDQRSLYPYFRGAHLGALGLALTLGYPSIAVLPEGDETPSAHVTGNYFLALQHAHNLATSADSLQFDGSHRKILTGLVDFEVPAVMPSIVFGLRPDAIKHLRPAPKTRMGCIAAPLTIEMIDPHSAAVLKSLLEMRC